MERCALSLKFFLEIATGWWVVKNNA